MTRVGWLALGLVLLLVVGAAGAWLYLAGPGTAAAKLVPADSLAFAYIPDGESVLSGYSGSRLRQLIDSPNAQPLLNWLQQTIGDKNLGLLRVLLPTLSGQSFLAVTHYDPANPAETGLIAGMKPKLGHDNFDAFIQQLNAAYPDLAGETKTGHDTLLGVDYQWIESPHAPGRLCVARSHGWIITTWGEASLQDWLERMQGKPATPSLAESDDFKKSRTRVGLDAQALTYIDYPRVLGLLTPRLTSSNPALADHLKKRLAGLGGAAIGTRFDGDEIVDHFSLLASKEAQQASGLGAAPCAFETLKFTGPETRFYFGTTVNWPQMWKNFQAEGMSAPGSLPAQLQAWAQSENIDLEKNLFDALGSEYSVQVEWASDALYPDVGVYFKVDQQDDFKPAVAALIDFSRKQFANSAVINEMQADGHNFATLKLVQPMPVSPTIVEDGPYFGFFLNETHAVRSFARDENRGLLHNDDFNRQIGDRRAGASQLMFLDAPRLLDQAYRTAQPYLPMGALFSPTLASMLRGRQLPADLAWLAPMGTWSAVFRADDDGTTGISRSGVGNQGILLAGGLASGAFALQSMGFLPQHRYTVPTAGNPFPASEPAGAGPGAAAPSIPPAPAAAPTPNLPPAPAAPPAPPDATTPPSPDGSTH